MKNYAIYVGLFILTVGLAATAADFSYTVPTAGVTPGPTWASNISTALTDLKTHTHTGAVTEGPTLGTASIVENATHQMNDNTLSEINGLTFNDGNSSAPANYSLYVSGNELTFKDESGNAIALTAGATNAVSGAIQTTRYMSIWRCSFEDALPQRTADGSVTFSEGSSNAWDANCPVPVPAGASVTIDSIVFYANTADADCRIENASVFVDNPANSTAPVASNVKAAEDFGVAYGAITFGTDIAVSDGSVAWVYLAPGKSAGSCDNFFFYGYVITYTAATGSAGYWNN